MSSSGGTIRKRLGGLWRLATGRYHREMRSRIARVEDGVVRLHRAATAQAKDLQRLDRSHRAECQSHERDLRDLRGVLTGLSAEIERMFGKLTGKGMAGRLARLERDTKALLRHAYIDSARPEHPNRLALQRFGLHSQNEEDGIVWSLINSGVEKTQRFVEIGCGTNGGNSGFLAAELGWSGLMVDGHEGKLERCRIRFERPGVRCVHAFVTREKVNDILAEHGMTGEVDLLSIDIDGNDYWIWEAVSACTPRLVIVEYNSTFGPERAVTIPYTTDFDRRADRGSRKGAMVYFGTSLAALDRLAEQKGYRLVAVEPRGINAFFLRDDVAPTVKAVSVRDAFRRLYKYATRGGAMDVYRHIKEHDLPLVDLDA